MTVYLILIFVVVKIQNLSHVGHFREKNWAPPRRLVPYIYWTEILISLNFNQTIWKWSVLCFGTNLFHVKTETISFRRQQRSKEDIYRTFRESNIDRVLQLIGRCVTVRDCHKCVFFEYVMNWIFLFGWVTIRTYIIWIITYLHLLRSEWNIVLTIYMTYIYNMN